MQYLQENFIYLRIRSGLNQSQLSTVLGFSKGTWNNYETGKSTPSLGDFFNISKYFGVTASQLLETDLKIVHLNINKGETQKGKNVHPIVHPTVHLKGEKDHFINEIKISIVAEGQPEYGNKSNLIPITDISVAAGGGHYNSDYIETTEAIQLPPRLLKSGCTYLCVKIKGISMAPTMHDGGYVVIRLLDRGDWDKMHNERCFVVIDNEGKTYLKRVKNRFNQGFIVLRSDSPDQGTFPPFNLDINDIQAIWYVEWYFTAKMPHVHQDYYQRLQNIEDRLDELQNITKKITRNETQ